MSKEGERDFRKEYLTGDDKAWLTHICFNGGGLNYIDYDWNNELLDEIDRLRGANKMLQDMVERKDERIEQLQIKLVQKSTGLSVWKEGAEQWREKALQLDKELALKEQVMGDLCHKCGWATQLPVDKDNTVCFCELETELGDAREYTSKVLQRYGFEENGDMPLWLLGRVQWMDEYIQSIEKERDQYKNALELLLGDIENYSEEDYPGENKKWVMEILRKNGLIPDEEKEDD